MQRARFQIALLAATLLCYSGYGATADRYDTSHGPVEISAQVTGLSKPWAFVFLPDGALLITERSGALRIWDGTLSTPIAGLPPLFPFGQGGLLDVALANDYTTSGEIYFSYAARTRDAAQTRVARARLDRQAMTLRDVTVIFAQEPPQQTGHHFGSRVVVGPDGSIYVTVGDRGEREQAQNTNAHQGSVIRILRDGTPHPANPFIAGGGRPEIFSYGHRNPQGATWAHGALWTVEHGAAGGDEINEPKAGLNYGWPTISYGQHYSGAKIGVGTAAEGMEQPSYYWDPSIAPSGLTVVSGPLFPEWKGDLLVGALKSQRLSRLQIKDGKVVAEEKLFPREFGRIRDVRIGPKGAIWFATDSVNGSIYRMAPVN
ncbi:MAG: PQQ-dependent sugar dehydrogenase [Pikeienuella sp.]